MIQRHIWQPIIHFQNIRGWQSPECEDFIAFLNFLSVFQAK